MQNRPISLIGGWEPLCFRRRAGYAWADEGDYVREEFSDSELDRFVAMGVNCIHIPFAKGYGLKVVAEDLEFYKDITRRAQARGLKVAHYYRIDAVVPETMVHERPTVKDWITRGMFDRSSMYSAQQTNRKRICLLHPGAVEWVEHVIRYAIEEMKTDLMHLDGFFVAYHPWETCRCTRCLQTYREWLKRKYADPVWRKKVFGIVDFDNIEFPEFEPNAPLPTIISSPDLRAWHEHQWDKQLAFARHIRRYILGLNPNVGMLVNVGWYRNANYYRQLSLLSERIFPWTDAVGLEDDFELSYTPERIVSRLGLLKTAREYGVLVYSYHNSNDEGEVEASLALSLASNGGSMGVMGFVHRYMPSYRISEAAKKRFGDWIKEHWETFRDAEQYGSIALLRHHASLAWNSREPWFAGMAMEQLLVQMRVPWRMLDQIDSVALSGVRTLVLAEIDCLSTEELDVLESWVKTGGRLFFTFRSGLFDGDRQRRSYHPLMRWSAQLEEKYNRALGPGDWFDWSVEDYEVHLEVAHRRQRHPEIVACGEGLLGFWPAIRTGLSGCASSRRILSADVCLPADHLLMSDFLRDLDGMPEVCISQGEGILFECTRHRDGTALFLHFINTQPQGRKVDAQVDISDFSTMSYEILSPDLDLATVVSSPSGLTISGLQRYVVIVLRRREDA